MYGYIGVTAEQEVHLSEPALGRTPVVTSTFLCLITVWPTVKLNCPDHPATLGNIFVNEQCRL